MANFFNEEKDPTRQKVEAQNRGKVEETAKKPFIETTAVVVQSWMKNGFQFVVYVSSLSCISPEWEI